MRNDRGRLLDILEAIARIDRHAIRGRETFERDELLQSWVVHNLQLIGEAARRLSDALRGEHPEVPWPAIIALRNYLVHDYFGVDLGIVWRVVDQDLPTLKEQIEATLRELGGQSPGVSEPCAIYKSHSCFPPASAPPGQPARCYNSDAFHTLFDWHQRRPDGRRRGATRAGGKSGLRRAGCWLTARGGDPTDQCHRKQTAARKDGRVKR